MELHITDREALIIKNSLQRELAHHYQQEFLSQKDEVPHLAQQHRQAALETSYLLDILTPALTYR